MICSQSIAMRHETNLLLTDSETGREETKVRVWWHGLWQTHHSSSKAEEEVVCQRMIRTFPCSAGSGGDNSAHYTTNVLLLVTFQSPTIADPCDTNSVVFSFLLMRFRSDQSIYRILVSIHSRNIDCNALIRISAYLIRRNSNTKKINAMAIGTGRDGFAC